MIDRKDIFMSGFKSKIGYSFTYKDLNEFEAIIDFYEQQYKKQKEVIDKLEKYIEKQTRLYGLSMPIELGTHLDNIMSILKRCQNE